MDIYSCYQYVPVKRTFGPLRLSYPTCDKNIFPNVTGLCLVYLPILKCENYFQFIYYY